MYNHDEDEEFDSAPTTGPTLSLSIPNIETISIFSTRQSPILLMCNKEAEHSPQRDARVLATMLSTSLPQETVTYLAELLFSEHLTPFLQQEMSKIPAVKKVLKKKPELRDEE